MDEANAIELARARGDLEKARRYEIDLAGREGASANLESRLGFDESVAVDQDAAKQTMRVAELHGGSQLRSHSYDEFQTLLEALRTENATIARGASKVSAAIEALLVFEEVQPLALGDLTLTLTLHLTLALALALALTRSLTLALTRPSARTAALAVAFLPVVGQLGLAACASAQDNKASMLAAAAASVGLAILIGTVLLWVG